MDDTFERVAHIESQQVNDEAILLDMNTGRYFRLNATANDIWKSLESPVSARGVARTVAPRYGMSAEELLSDIEASLTDMAGLGVLRRVRGR